MSLPRRLTLTGKNDLGMEPAGDIESLRYNHQRIGRTKLPANQEVVLDEIRGNSMELIAEIEATDAPTAGMVELNVFGRRTKRSTPESCSSGTGASGIGTPEGHDSMITIDSSYSSILPDARPRPPETAPVSIGTEESLKLRVFVDRSVVEVIRQRQTVCRDARISRTR